MPIRHSGKSPQQQIKEIKTAIKALPVKLANTALNHFLNNFNTESFEGKKWKERNAWAVRNTERKLLRDTGTLYRAMTKQVNGMSIRVFVAPPSDKYGTLHNDGGTITIKPNSKSIKFFWAKYYAATSGVEKSRWKAMALAMQSGKSMTIKMPQRKFMGNSPQLFAKLKAKIETELNKVA